MFRRFLISTVLSAACVCCLVHSDLVGASHKLEVASWSAERNSSELSRHSTPVGQPPVEQSQDQICQNDDANESPETPSFGGGDFPANPRSEASGQSVDDGIRPVDDSTKSAILSDMAQMWALRKEFASTVRYHLSGTAEHAQGSIVGAYESDPENGIVIPPTGYPIRDTAYDVEVEWLIDFPSGKFRKLSHDKSFNVSKAEFRPFVRRELFDGEGLKGNWPREANSSPIYTPHADKEEIVFWEDGDLSLVVNVADFPIFYAHGLYGVSPGELSAAGFVFLSLHVLGTADVRGRECVVVSDHPAGTTVGGRSSTYYADRSNLGAILRLEVRNNGVLSDSVDIHYENQVTDWIPSRWKYEAFSGSIQNNRVLTTYDLKVDAVDLHPEVREDDFKLQMEPGMVVLRRDQEGAKRVVGADGRSLEPYLPVSLRKAGSRWQRMLVINLTLITLGGILFLVSRWRKAKLNQGR